LPVAGPPSVKASIPSSTIKFYTVKHN
jgi:hypothetical protein